MRDNLVSVASTRFALRRFFAGLAAGACAIPAAFGLAFGVFVISAPAVHAAADQNGRSTGLPVPRYVSIKSSAVNMRRGPAREHVTVWTYKKAGLPLEITGEFENWRKVRDWEGSEGWVYHTLLSGRRTAMVAPWKKDGLIEVRTEPVLSAAPAARLGPRVITRVHNCDRQWCRISGEGFQGYVPQKALWGVYPDEKIK